MSLELVSSVIHLLHEAQSWLACLRVDVPLRVTDGCFVLSLTCRLEGGAFSPICLFVFLAVRGTSLPRNLPSTQVSWAHAPAQSAAGKGLRIPIVHSPARVRAPVWGVDMSSREGGRGWLLNTLPQNIFIHVRNIYLLSAYVLGIQ